MRAIWVFLLVWLVSGCSPSVPEVRPGSGPQEGAPKGHPGQMRLAIAASPDGLTFTPTGRHIADQAGVPNAILDGDGAIRVYYNDIFNRNQITVALSRNQGKTWRYYRVEVTDLPANHLPPVDPTVVRLEDGRYRLYFSLAARGSPPRTWSAVSRDGYRFQAEGVRWVPERGGLYDPIAVRVGGVWVLLVMNDERVVLLLSPDGLKFEPAATPEPFDRLRTGNCINLEDGRARCYMFGPGGARSVVSRDGRSWVLEDGVRLAGVTEPAVVKLKDGSYLMVYQQPLRP